MRNDETVAVLQRNIGKVRDSRIFRQLQDDASRRFEGSQPGNSDLLRLCLSL